MPDIGRGSRGGAVPLEVTVKRCGQTRQWSAALQLLREGVQFGVQLSPCHYVAAASACRHGGQWQHALCVLSEMWEAKLEPSVTSPLQRWSQRVREGHAVAGGSGAAQRDVAGKANSRLSYSAGISACEKGKQWQRALALFGEMLAAKLEPNVTVPYSAGISACEKGEQWQRALALLCEMLGAKLQPNVSLLQRWDQRVREGRAVAGGSGAAQRDVGGDAGARCHRYSAGISACEKAEKWQRALVLLSKMWEVRLEPNVISLRRRDQRLREGQAVAAGSGAAHRCAGGEARAQLSYNAGISACENGEQWQRALALVSEMQDAKLEPNITSPTMCWDQRLRKGQSVAAGFGAAQRSAGGEAGARGHQLQRWGQSVREGRAMAAGFGAAWRDAGGETRSGQHQLHRWGQRVRVWRAVATGFGVAQRDVGDDV
ncbi:unnamed protein product [Prorocentrum cordatum]|uniref:Pentatricopeptide repeat-containing protein, chloroplastic n=1 Tax=Prorocentrum cordatum TaxID=2364126 RepID=A0ABN9W2D5_9DINO|nr:unnamed protein product [Polarella glacialis]